MENLWAPWRIKYIETPKKSESCIFCSALDEPEKRYVLDKDKYAMVIMNIYPYNPGHLMVAPVRHVGDFKKLTKEEYISIGEFIKKSMDVLEKTMKPEGFNIGINLGMVAGAGVKDHIHVHIVPRWCGDTNFMPVTADVKVLGESLEDTYKKLKENW
ncbi:MAG: HIT family protein [Thermoplasmata archaeon]|nr:HIT domain-containing protein [Thermoplasmata archaeon]